MQVVVAGVTEVRQYRGVSNSNRQSILSRYSMGAIAFHWIIAILIAVNYVSAWRAEDLPKAAAAQLMGTHKAIGITVLLLTVLRIVWRLVNRPPALSASLKPWEARFARVTHSLFYVLMITVPLAGWIMHSAFLGGASINVFDMFSYPGLPLGQNKAAADVAHELHEITATLMLALIAVHVLGALKHQWIDRDGSLGRMLPWGR